MLFRKIARQVTTAPDGFAAGPVPARHRAQLKGRQRLLDRLGGDRLSYSLTFLLIYALVSPALAPHAAEFYFDPRGNDLDHGTSEKHPWKSLDRANQHIAEKGLKPGDTLRFRGGSTFEGYLRLDHAGGGIQSAPVRITSYGRGRATFKPGVKTGILIRETAWVSVSHLNLVAAIGNLGDGIRCDRTQESELRIRGLTIQDCSVLGFGWHGVMVDAAQRSHGFDGVLIERCVAQGNRHAGIMVYGGNPTGRSQRAHANIRILDCLAAENLGDPDELKHHSGSGIFLDGVETALIRGCVAAKNGANCRNERGGPVGIWAHASSQVRIERCESYGNASRLRDGGGFDLDGGCEDCVLRWNFSHHNHGPGFLIYTYTGAAYADRDCQVYGNISWNDGAKSSGYAGIQIGAEEGCQIRGLKVAYNTVIAPQDSVGAIRILGHSIDASIRSNLVVAPIHGILVAISGFKHRVHFHGNRYWREDKRPVFLVDFQWSIPSLDSWSNATGPDTRFTSEADLFLDPYLKRLRFPDPQILRSHPSWPQLSHRFLSEVGAPSRPPME